MATRQKQGDQISYINRFATINEAEFNRIMNKEVSKFTRKATESAVSIFRAYLIEEKY